MRETVTIGGHFCVTCGKYIKPGTRCRVISGIDEKGGYVNKHQCLVCDPVPRGTEFELRSLRAKG